MLVFHEQYLTDEQHLAFSHSLGELEEAAGTSLREDYRLPTTFADVSNLEPTGVGARRPSPLARDRQPAVALRQLIQGRAIQVFVAARRAHPVQGWQHGMPTCAPRTMRWTRTPRPWLKI
jgi:hypothetical protein